MNGFNFLIFKKVGGHWQHTGSSCVSLSQAKEHCRRVVELDPAQILFIFEMKASVATGAPVTTDY